MDPGEDWEDSGYLEHVYTPTTILPQYFSMDYECDVLHTEDGDITIGDMATHGLIYQKQFTGMKRNPMERLDQPYVEFGKAFGIPLKDARGWNTDAHNELARPLVEKAELITPEDAAIAIEKFVGGARILYTLWDHVTDRCPIREVAHAGYSLEERKQYEGFESLPWYLRDGKEPN